MDLSPFAPRVVALVIALLALPVSGPFAADPPPAPASPSAVKIEGGDFHLIGRRATRQLLATGTYADGSVRDLSRAVQWSSANPEVAIVSPRGQVVPRGDGSAILVARGDGFEAQAAVTVSGWSSPAPVSFRRDVIPAFSQAGCNMGACHGTPTGKGGFKLSLRGYMPEADFVALSREAAGRRIEPLSPESSLILRKPLGEVPHEGGLRLFRDTKTYEFLRDWVAEGAKDDAGGPSAVSLEIAPGSRLLNAPATTQQVAVIARYSDGSARDVTPICYYNSSAPEIADVDPTGYVTFKSRGEVAIIAHYLDLVANVRLTHLVDVPGFAAAEVPKENAIDSAVFAKLNRMRIMPSELSSDAEFIRRVYLDCVGILPPPEDVKRLPERPVAPEAIGPGRPPARSPGIPRLLDPEVRRHPPGQRPPDPAQGRSHFESLDSPGPGPEQADGPIRQSCSTSGGSTYQNAPANYYRISRDPESSVETTAQLFLGVRIQCAKCHNHPFERWTQDDYYGFAAFFSRVKRKPGNQPEEEVIYSATAGEVRQPRTGKVMSPKALGGPVFDGKGTSQDRRDALAAWLTSADNPFFSKSLVNRIWFHLMGRGIVEPVDDFRDSNPASNDELLDSLAADFARNGYDLKGLIRSILSSRTYQLSARTNDLNADDTIYFSHAYTKLLPAEVLLDAISTLTGTNTAFDGLPKGSHATQIPDGKMENSFLKTFGRPARELACECERESDANLSQALQLIGGATVNGKLHDDSGRLAAMAKTADMGAEQVVTELYLRAVSREPNSTEMEIAVSHLKAATDRRQAIEDIGWALINSKEFLFRH